MQEVEAVAPAPPASDGQGCASHRALVEHRSTAASRTVQPVRMQRAGVISLRQIAHGVAEWRRGVMGGYTCQRSSLVRQERKFIAPGGVHMWTAGWANVVRKRLARVRERSSWWSASGIRPSASAWRRPADAARAANARVGNISTPHSRRNSFRAGQRARVVARIRMDEGGFRRARSRIILELNAAPVSATGHLHNQRERWPSQTAMAVRLPARCFRTVVGAVLTTPSRAGWTSSLAKHNLHANHFRSDLPTIGQRAPRKNRGEGIGCVKGFLQPQDDLRGRIGDAEPRPGLTARRTRDDRRGAECGGGAQEKAAP